MMHILQKICGVGVVYYYFIGELGVTKSAEIKSPDRNKFGPWPYLWIFITHQALGLPIRVNGQTAFPGLWQHFIQDIIFYTNGCASLQIFALSSLTAASLRSKCLSGDGSVQWQSGVSALDRARKDWERIGWVT